MSQLFKEIEASQKSQFEICVEADLSPASLSRAKKRNTMHVETLERLAEALGYEVVLKKRKSTKAPALKGAAAAWSSPSKRDTLKLLPARLANASFKDLLDSVHRHGFDAVQSTMDRIRPEIPEKRYLMQKEMLNNINKALAKPQGK